MKKNKKRTGSTMRCTGILMTLLVLISVTLAGSAFALSATSATRDIEKQTLAPGESTKVTIVISNGESQALSLGETVPAGWTLTRGTDDASQFKPSTNEWIWFGVAAGATKTVTYTLGVPSAATAGDYDISGAISNAGGVIATVGGENKVTVKTDPSTGTTTGSRDIEKQTLVPGESTKVIIAISNGGNQALSLKESLPAGLTLTRGTDDADSFKASTNEWAWFNVAAGATKTVIYTLGVQSTAIAGDYDISGAISNAGGVIASVGGENKVTIKVGTLGTSATRDIGTQTLAPGGSTKVTIAISNGASQALSLMETIPAGWTLTRGTDGADSFKANTNEWLWFNVAAGTTKTVTYTLTVPSAATAGDYDISGAISNAGGVIATVGGENKVTVKIIPTDKNIWISGTVFNDLNINGVKNSNEKGLKNWEVSIQKVGKGGFKKTVKTDKNGNYKFANLLSGNYLVSVKHQNGWKHTTASIKSVYLKTGNKVVIKFGEVKKP